jgi:hypothetical protein
MCVMYVEGCAESASANAVAATVAADEPYVHRDTHECVRAARADRSDGSRYADTRHVARSIHHRPPPRRRRARHRVAGSKR